MYSIELPICNDNFAASGFSFYFSGILSILSGNDYKQRTEVWRTCRVMKGNEYESIGQEPEPLFCKQFLCNNRPNHGFMGCRGADCMEHLEKRLIQKAKAGDRSAFGKLVTVYQDRILYLIYDYVHDYEDAKDLAQDVFIKAFERLNQFEGRSKFSTWLYRIAVNRALDFRRKIKKNRMQNLDSDEKPGQIVDEVSRRIEDELEQDELRRQIEAALRTISDHQRTAVILKYFQHFSTDEIAQIMACTPATVRTHLYRAIGHLRKQLMPDGFAADADDSQIRQESGK
jgi:RNA polymerase sigma-70 factor (ECF subfamily)